MQIIKYYCDRCKEEGNIIEGHTLVNHLLTEKIPNIMINPLDENKYIFFKEICLCEKCREEYIQLIQKIDEWVNNEGDNNDGLIINVSCNLVGANDIEKMIEELQNKLNSLRVNISI